MAKLGATLAALLLAVALAPAMAQAPPAVVAILTTIEHPTLDAVRDGVRDALKDRGLIEGENLELIYESAQADPQMAEDIAERFAARQPDVAIAISAPAAGAMVPMGDRMPLVITALGPEKANGITNGTGSVAGLVQPPPFREQLELVLAIAPETKQLLVPHRTDQANIDSDFRAAAQAADLALQPVHVRAAQSMGDMLAPHLNGSTAILLLQNQSIEAIIEPLVELAVERQVPIFADTEDAVTRGALATIDYDPYDVGRQTGVQVLEILAGEAPGDLGLIDARPTRVVLNEDTAERMELRLPSDVIDRARFVVEGPFDRPVQRKIPRPVPPPCEGTARCE